LNVFKITVAPEADPVKGKIERVQNSGIKGLLATDGQFRTMIPTVVFPTSMR
jgi:hypothetical protein